MAAYRLSAFADEADARFTGQIEALKEEKIGLIEVRGVDGKNVMQLTDDEAREARAKLDAACIGLSALGSPIGKISITEPFEPHLAALSRAIELCEILGTDKIRMFSFFIPQNEDPEKYRAEVFARMEAMLTLAEKAGIKLLHENEKGIYGDTDERCLTLLRAFEGRLGCVFDPANFIQCGVRPAEALPAMLPYIDYVHIKDALLLDGAVVPAGAGDGQIAEVLNALADKADGMILTLEPHLTVFDGLKAIQHEELTHKYTYPDNRAAFRAASEALKEVLRSIGFEETMGGTNTWTR